jgi:hypothetical protein
MDHEHWYMVPLPLRNTITKLYAGGDSWPGYEEACQNAVDQVVERLGRIDQNLARVHDSELKAARPPTVRVRRRRRIIRP